MSDLRASIAQLENRPVPQLLTWDDEPEVPDDDDDPTAGLVLADLADVDGIALNAEDFPADLPALLPPDYVDDDDTDDAPPIPPPPPEPPPVLKKITNIKQPSSTPKSSANLQRRIHAVINLHQRTGHLSKAKMKYFVLAHINDININIDDIDRSRNAESASLNIFIADLAAAKLIYGAPSSSQASHSTSITIIRLSEITSVEGFTDLT